MISTFFLVWHLWNCSTLVQIISVFLVILCQSLKPHLRTPPTLLWHPSTLCPGSTPLYFIHHAVKSSNSPLLLITISMRTIPNSSYHSPQPLFPPQSPTYSLL